MVVVKVNLTPDLRRNSAMGIGGGIRQCLRKCRPMLVLRRQKNVKVFTYAVFLSGFTVLLVMTERFNLVYS